MSWARESTSYTIPGAVFVLGYALLNAGKSVLEGAVLVELSPEFLAVNCFVLAQAGYFFLHRDRKALRGKVGAHWRLFAALNLTTALSWLGVLYALNTLEPAVVNSLIVGMLPVVTVALAPRLRPNGHVTTIEVVGAVASLLVVLFLIWVSLQGRSGLGTLDAMSVVVGTLAAAFTALGVSTNTFVTKALSERGVTSADMMATRFTVLNVIAVGVVAGSGSWSPYTPDTILTILVLAVVGVFVAIYLLQIGIARTEPTTVSLLFTTNLIFTFAIQVFDPRISVSLLSCAGILALSAITVFSTVGASRARLRWRASINSESR